MADPTHESTFDPRTLQPRARRENRTRKSKKSRTRDPAEVRRRLLAAATELFATRGFEAVNSNQIARYAGVGVGTFYNHFQDKFELHQAVVLEALEAFRRRVAHSVARPGGTIEEQVRDLVEAVVGYAETDPARFRVAFGTVTSANRAPRPPRDRSNNLRPSRAQVGYSTRVTERRLAELKARGQLDSRLHPGVAACAFVAMQNSAVCWWLADKDRASREALIETLICLHPAVAGATRD